MLRQSRGRFVLIILLCVLWCEFRVNGSVVRLSAPDTVRSSRAGIHATDPVRMTTSGNFSPQSGRNPAIGDSYEASSVADSSPQALRLKSSTATDNYSDNLISGAQLTPRRALEGLRFVTASADFGRTFNRIRHVFTLVETARLLNRTAVIPLMVPGERGCGDLVRFDEGLRQHVNHVTLSSFMDIFAPHMRTGDLATSELGAEVAAELGLPRPNRSDLPHVQAAGGAALSYGSVSEPVIVLEPMVNPMLSGIERGEWTALFHMRFDPAIELLGDTLLR